MGVADLIAAFNEVASPRFAASKALMGIERRDGAEWSRLTFSGMGIDGAAFDVVSDPLPPGADPIPAARLTAQSLLDSRPPPSPLILPESEPPP